MAIGKRTSYPISVRSLAYQIWLSMVQEWGKIKKGNDSHME